MNTRLHVAEAKIDHIDKILDKRWHMGQRIIELQQHQDRELEAVRTGINALREELVLTIERHMRTDATQRARQAKTAFWTLLTVMLTLLFTLAGTLIQRTDILN